MSYLFFFIYLTLFCWLLTRIKFITNTGIENRILIILFLIRIIAGVINGYINLYYYTSTDATFFHRLGIEEYHLLFNDPKEYFTNLFKYHHQNSGLLDITDSFWNNLRSDVMIKLLSFFNILSRGNFFINIIFYNFLIFFGSVSLYKIFISLFPEKKAGLIIILFLLPSLLYFTAGVHKDGLIFLGLGISCYYLFLLIKKGLSIKNFLWLLLGLAIIFLLRNFVLITLFPAIIAWIISEKNRKFILQTYIFVYLFFILIFFSIGNLLPAFNLPEYVSIRQIAFVQISKASESAININPLFPNFRSFLNNAPQAINHSLMRPYLTEKGSLLSIFAAMEIFIYQVLFFLFLLFRLKNKKTDAFIYFCIFFSVSMFLMIGYTIPIMGAIVRYRSIYLPFILIPILFNIDWEKLRKFAQINK